MTMFKETGIRQQVIEEIIQIAKLNHVEKVILFGFRARGDYKERSDIDLAFSGGNSSEFILTVDEETSTLLKFDVVDLEKPVGKELRESIEREGMVIYEEIWEFQNCRNENCVNGWYNKENIINNRLAEDKWECQ